LLEKENNLRENLQNEVTKVKEKLEKFLSQSDNVIKTSEKINKGIKILEKEEKNMIKTLTYVSKINKLNKEMKILNQELMRNLKISFQEEENNIKYEEYYFNGIPTPKNIEFKDINSQSFKIYWNIDNINLLNINNKEIKFKVEIKKKNTNEEFIQVYEGNNNNCLIENLKDNTNYKVKICCIHNDLIGPWTKIQKVKTDDFISIILNSSDRKNEFLKKIYEWSGTKSLELLFRGTRDGMYSKNFHEKCDDKGPTITLFRNDKGNIFGGYLPISWKSEGGYQNENRCFIFTLTNIHNIQPTKFENKKDCNQVFFGKGNGPCFYDTWIESDFINNCSSYLGSHYQDTTGKGLSILTGNSNNNERKIILNELEVYKII